MSRNLLVISLLIGLECTATGACWPGYVEGYWDEQAREIQFAEGCRAIVLAPPLKEFDAAKPTVLVIYATPNGNTAEQTLGCQLTEGLDWHFDIQHVAAQWRFFRRLETTRNVVLACMQANELSWPAWKAKRPQGTAYIRQLVDGLAANLAAKDVRIVLAGHSGGGSFLFGFIDAVEKIPQSIERIVFLDANYSYDTEARHGEKLLRWLGEHPRTRLAVVAYDDRNIELHGKKVVSPTGGTFRATGRMLEFLRKSTEVVEKREGEVISYSAVGGRLVAFMHTNPDNIILHTRLVGEMNGLIVGLAHGTHASWSRLQSPRAYSEYVQPEPYDTKRWQVASPALPVRPADAGAGGDVIDKLMKVNPTERERVIASEILKGNVPQSWRQFVEVTTEMKDGDGRGHRIVYRVAPDYLGVGCDRDFVRMPLTPYVAQYIADQLGCVLPTRKMVDDINRTARVRVAPKPLSEDRESVATFLLHHRLIQQAGVDKSPGELVAGIKKDVVITNRLSERGGRVAIYGWHRPGGQPIQPLTTVHVDTYVDYSHGVRLVDRWCHVDGQSRLVTDVMRDPILNVLVSDEGPLENVAYRRQLQSDRLN